MFPVLADWEGAFSSEPAWRTSAKEQGFWEIQDLWEATFIVSKQMAVEYVRMGSDRRLDVCGGGANVIGSRGRRRLPFGGPCPGLQAFNQIPGQEIMADKLTAWELLKGYDGGRGWVLDRYHPATYRIRVYEVRAQPRPPRHGGRQLLVVLGFN
jgi:hypothetical protein